MCLMKKKTRDTVARPCCCLFEYISKYVNVKRNFYVIAQLNYLIFINSTSFQAHYQCDTSQSLLFITITQLTTQLSVNQTLNRCPYYLPPTSKSTAAPFINSSHLLSGKTRQ